MFDFLPPSMLWPAYWASLGVIALFTLGVGGRVTAVLATVATLSFFSPRPAGHRRVRIHPRLPAGLPLHRPSERRVLRPRAAARARSLRPIQHPASSLQHPPLNTISLRLIQIHLALVHLMMGWAQLAAPEGAWWSGEGVWLAAMRPGMSLVDFSFLTDHPRIVAAWSHLITLYLLAFPVLVWGRLTRPIILAARRLRVDDLRRRQRLADVLPGDAHGARRVRANHRRHARTRRCSVVSRQRHICGSRHHGRRWHVGRLPRQHIQQHDQQHDRQNAQHEGHARVDLPPAAAGGVDGVDRLRHGRLAIGERRSAAPTSKAERRAPRSSAAGAASL